MGVTGRTIAPKEGRTLRERTPEQRQKVIDGARAARLLRPKKPDLLWSMVPMTAGDGCWLWLGPISWTKCKKGMNGGYGRARINDRYIASNRAMWMAVKGPIPDGLEVCHTCDVRHCVNPRHLYLGTHSQNIVDCRKRGRLKVPHGIKLSEEKVREIVRLTAEGWTTTELAEEYGVWPLTINKVLTRQSWKDVTAGLEIRRPTRDAWAAGIHSERQSAAIARFQSVLHTCELCGRVVKGNAIGAHRKACARTSAAANQ